MGKRYDVMTAREYEHNGATKTFWRKLGTGFPTKDGKGIRIQLEGLPVSGELLVKVHEEDRQQPPSDDLP